MRLDDDGFETEAKDMFVISITQETEISLDGGYEFEVVRNAVELDVDSAKLLITELQNFVDRQRIAMPELAGKPPRMERGRV